MTDPPDESVKEALASELVLIIWWFVTRCQLVDEEIMFNDCAPEEVEVPVPQNTAVVDQDDQPAQIELQPQRTGTPSSLGSRHRSDSEPVIPAHLHTVPPDLHRTSSSPDPSSRHSTHHSHNHNPLTALAHSSPNNSPHPHHIALPPLPPPHTPDHPSPLGQSVHSADPPENNDTVPTGPALISVQSFTPILGTLLLSPNPHVGGPARYAVVELLRRVRKADDFAHGTDTQRPVDPAVHPLDDDEIEERYEDVGFFGEEQRRMFEREMIYQVVIGMGRLDMPEELAIEEDVEAEAVAEESASSTTTATPLTGFYSPAPRFSSPGMGDSYFPIIPPADTASPHNSPHQHHTSPRAPPAIASPTVSTGSPLSIPMPPQPTITSFADFASSGLFSPPLEMTQSPSLSTLR